MDKTIELLNKYLDGDFKVTPMSPRKSSINDINKFEKKMEIKLPKEYISHLLAKDSEILQERGLFIEVKESVWERPKLYDVGPAWSFLYGINTYTVNEDTEDWMKLSYIAKEFIEDTGIKAIPLLKVVGDADCYCSDEKGSIVRYNHEENIIEEVNMNFWEVLEIELKELKERKNRKKDSC